ncbi:MAG: hypothetical protein HY964_04680 [Ignavibacteriales bacterium]|nr:hypothetical protein [Ignavibacteriales bacterium]
MVKLLSNKQSKYKRKRMILTVIFFSLFFCGCFYVGKDRYEDVLQKPSIDWSSRDALTVIISPIANNLFDQQSPNIKVFATPYYPSVILGIQRAAQQREHWSEEQFCFNTDQLLKDGAGLYMDWESYRFVDARGNYFHDKTQIDSMLFLITIENRSWPCNIPIMTALVSNGGRVAYQNVPLASPSDWPCYMPEITDIKDRIFLINSQNKYIKPKYIWGVRHNILSNPETIFAMFHFRNGDYHFLKKSNKMFLVIEGFENEIKLSFPLSMMR